MGLIYKLDFSSGKSYIGLTTGTLVRRLKQHRYDAAKRKGFLVHSAWLKHGDPVASVLFEGEGEALKQAERDAIVKFNTVSPNGYNLIVGGPTPVWSAETRAKMGLAHKGKPKSDEQKAKMSAAHKGRPKTTSERIAMALGQKARDPATRNDLSKHWTGKKQNPEHVAKRIASRIATLRSRGAF